MLWDLENRTKTKTLVHRGRPMHLFFSADGARLVSYSQWDQRLLLWDVGTGQKLLELRAFAVNAYDFLAEGTIKLLLRSEGSSSVELWELAHGEEFQTLAGQEQPAFGPCIRASVSPDNRILVLSRERGLEMWDLATRQCIAAWPGGTCMAEFDRAGHLVVACDSGIYRWPRKDEQQGEGTSSSPELLVRFGPPEKLTGVLDPTTLSAGQVGPWVAFADKAGWKSMQLDGLGKTVPLPTKHDPRKAAVSGDGRHVAIANWFAGGVAIWDAASGRHLIDLPVGKLGDLVFSPDGTLLASTPDGVRLWRTSDWQLASELRASGSTPNGLGIAFSRDGRALAVGQPNGILRLVDTQTGADWRVSRSSIGVVPR